jgi:PAS domain S-box-containing protein
LNSCNSERDDQTVLGGDAETQPPHSRNIDFRGRTDGELLHEIAAHRSELESLKNEFKRAQALNEECRIRYASLFDYSPVGYLVLSEKGTVAKANLTGASLLKTDRDNLINSRFEHFVANDDFDLWCRYFADTKLNSDKCSCELGLRRGDGSEFQAKLDCLSIKTDGEMTVRVVFSDVTEQYREEMQIQKRQQKISGLNSLHIATQTALAIAHELNQPLLAIATYSQAALMMMKSDKPNLDKIQKAVYGCEKQALRAGQSIRELLEFLSIEEFSNETFDLNSEVLEVLGDSRLELGLQIDTDIQMEKELPYVRANLIHVKKVLVNLFRNGIEAMQDANTPRPAITVMIRSKADENVAHVTVSDNGPGVKEEDVHRMFKPFFTTKDKGIGMGLAVSRSLIEANGGKLWIEPQACSGATFHLTLPFAS